MHNCSGSSKISEDVRWKSDLREELTRLGRRIFFVVDSQNGIGSPNFDYTVGNSTLEIDSDVRAAVVAEQSYTVSFATWNSGNLNGADFFVDWYDNNNDFTGLIFTSNLGNPCAEVTSPAVNAPLTVFSHDLVAPAGSTHAAFRFSTAGTSGDVLTNDFSIQNAQPTAESELLNFTINVGNQQATPYLGIGLGLSIPHYVIHRLVGLVQCSGRQHS